MRKADYLTLAAELKRRYSSACDVLNGYHGDKPAGTFDAALSEKQQTESLARYLADHLSVNRGEFLKACGIRA
jgi:hypothetical protein